jgi:type IV secretory pathway TrbD component
MADHTRAGEPIASAGYKQPQLFGGDKRLVLWLISICGMGALISVVALESMAAFITFALVWFLCLTGLQKMGKADPFMRQIAWRHFWQRRYYPARPGVYAESISFPREWRTH